MADRIHAETASGVVGCDGVCRRPDCHGRLPYLRASTDQLQVRGPRAGRAVPAASGSYERRCERTDPLREPRVSTQFGDASWYDWLLSIGLSPRKSLTLGAIAVPDRHLFPLLRGLLDGDGSVLNRVTRADTGRRTDYYWEYLLTRFVSASRDHLEWIAARVEASTGMTGYLQEVRRANPDPQRHPFFHLRYGKRASHVLLPLLYPDGAPCLERKRAIWIGYAARHGLRPAVESGLRPGDVMAAMQV